jgi:stage III sporulation protein AB
MIKAALLAIILAASFAVGIFFKNALSNRCIILRQMRYAIDEIELLLKYKNSTLREIFITLSEDSRLRELTFIHKTLEYMGEENFADSYKKAVSEFTALGLAARDREIIDGVGQILGVADADSQIAGLAVYKSELETAFDTAREEYSKKSKLFTSLGLLAGVFIVIILI